MTKKTDAVNPSKMASKATFWRVMIYGVKSVCALTCLPFAVCMLQLMIGFMAN